MKLQEGTLSVDLTPESWGRQALRPELFDHSTSRAFSLEKTTPGLAGFRRVVGVVVVVILVVVVIVVIGNLIKITGNHSNH